MAQTGNWTEERTATQGTGDITVSGVLSNDNVLLRDSLQAGEVWATVANGNNREAGIYTFDGVDSLQRTTIHATYENGVYNTSNPTPINLSGASVVSCTFNTAAFQELEIGNPLVDGYVLSSTIAGVRSWIDVTTGGVTNWGGITGDFRNQSDLVNNFTMKIANVATLRATDGATDGRTANLVGYTTNGDGGGGDFYWDAASTATDNGGTIFKVSTVTTGRWIRIYSGATNSLWFGVNGNGATVDSALYLTAINATPVGGELFSPSSTYLMSGDVLSCTKSMTFKGERGTVFKLDTSTSSEKLMNVSGAGSIVVFDGITFDINQLVADSWTNIMLNINGVSEIIIKSTCRFINSVASAYPAANNGYGIYLNGAYGKITIENGVVFKDHRFAVLTENSSTGSQVKIGASFFENLAGDGVEINVPTGTCEDISIIGASFKNIGTTGVVGRGFAIGASCNTAGGIKKLKVIGCDIDGARINGVHIEKGVANYIIHDNAIEGCGIDSITSAGSAIVVAESTDPDTPSKGSIKGNNILSTSGTDFGIDISGSNPASDVDVIGNTVDGAGNGIGIRIGSVISAAKVNYNTVKNSNGVGIRYSADDGEVIGNICYDDQGTKTQTYGLELDSNVQRSIIKDNKLVGNINKGISKLDAINLAIPLTGDYKELELDVSALSSSSSADTNMIDLGEGAVGNLFFTVLDGTDYASRMYTIDWDGTTLTPVEISSNSSGVLAISSTPSVALTMSGNILRCAYFNSDSVTRTADLEMTFSGIIMFK